MESTTITEVYEIVYDFSELLETNNQIKDLIESQNVFLQNIFTSFEVLIILLSFILGFLVANALMGSWFDGL